MYHTQQAENSLTIATCALRHRLDTHRKFRLATDIAFCQKDIELLADLLEQMAKLCHQNGLLLDALDRGTQGPKDPEFVRRNAAAEVHEEVMAEDDDDERRPGNVLATAFVIFMVGLTLAILAVRWWL